MADLIINELDTQLASLNQLKPPGASKGKIGSITTLCVSNIQVESSIVQSLYRALKKAPPTHKLGALYVLDSVVRQWIDHAKKNGRDLHIEGRGEPGTYAAAVKRVTELMPALFEDTLKGIPQEQKPKLENIITIWEKGNTFPPKLLADFKTRLAGGSEQSPAQTNGAQMAPAKQPIDKFIAPVPSRPIHTPVGYPPQHLYEQGFIRSKEVAPQVNGGAATHRSPGLAAHAATPVQQSKPTPAAPGQDVSSILAALASAAPKPTAPILPQSALQVPAPTAQPAGLPPNIAALFGQQFGGQPFVHQPASLQPSAFPPAQSMQMPNFQSPTNFPGFYPAAAQPGRHTVAAPPPLLQQPADPLAPLRGILPPNILNDQPKLVMALNLLQDLQKQGLPMDQWGPILKAFDDQHSSAQPTNNSYSGQDAYGRRRSRSPERGGVARRASPVYGTYEEIAGRRQPTDDERGHHGSNQGGRNKYRQRSPIRDVIMRDSPGTLAMNGKPMQPKYIAIDNSLPPNHIKVLSRTLFVGGANGTQHEIQNLFERFGRVQTCIANRDKRHAFVKMTTRAHALSAKAGMEELQARNDREVMTVARQTKWGVGFGPRECCDYQKGESIIPTHKLTEADVKWLLTAEYGGTGGAKIEAGMVLEEPDIEIGAGVSSKAMSKRVMPDAGPPAKRQQREERQRVGPGRNHKEHEAGFGGGGGYGGVGAGQQAVQMEAYGYARPEAVAVAAPPAVPTFGFSLPGQQPYR